MKGRFLYSFSKRVFDVVVSAVGLILLFPFMFIIAVLIKISSSGPIFYLGERVGLNGKPFKIIKFRTMELGSDKGASTTSRNDPRVTFVGKLLRRYKLDEFPQLINVFIGDMSFVGPRPELKKYTDQYTAYERRILSVKPGITDYSSIYYSNLNELIDDEDPDASFETKILPKKNQLRAQYVNECSMLVDIKIIIETILKLFGVKWIK